MIQRHSARRPRAHLTESGSDRAVGILGNALLALVAFACIYPFLNVVAKSFSGEAAVLAGEIWLLPKGFNVDAYRMVLGSARFLQSFKVTAFITALGTLLNVLLTTFVAYAVSRRDLPGRGAISFLYMFTMLFGGGMIPTYLVITAAGLNNSLFALIIPGLVAPFHVVLMRNYFASLPEALEESAKIDGASAGRTLFQIYLPLSLPSVATIALFCAVGYWNEYFGAMLYLSERSKATIQLYLREVLMSVNSADLANLELFMHVPQESVRGATVLTATLPVLLIYPLLQKYYVQGMTVGAVKA